MNALRPIRRGMVKALAVGAVLVAATLPLAAATAASAAANPTVYAVYQGAGTAAGGTLSYSTASQTVTVVATLTGSIPAGDMLVDANHNYIGTLGTTLLATTGSTATLLTNATETNAGDTTALYYAPFSFGAGGLPANGESIYIAGLGFANNGGTVTVTSSDADLTFSGATESSSILATATIKSPTAAVLGPQSLTLTDANGASNTLANAFTVNADPTVSSVSPSSMNAGQGLAPGAPTEVTVSGTFALSPTLASDIGSLSLTNITDGTSLEIANTQANLASNPTCTAANQGEPATVSSTQVQFFVAALNCATGGSATPGTYALSVTNADGGSVTTGAVFTVNAYGISIASPGSVPAGSTAFHMSLYGGGLLTGGEAVAQVGGTSTCTAMSVGVTSPTTASLTLTTGANGDCEIQFTNGGNAAVSDFYVGVGTSSGPPFITAVTSPTSALSAGGAASTFSVTGMGFDPYNGETVAVYSGTTSNPSGVTATCTSDPTGTVLACTASAASGAVTGSDNIVVTNKGTATPAGVSSNRFDNALSVGGPAITSSVPSTLSVGMAIGSVVNLTGTGLTNTFAVHGAILGGTGLNGNLSYVSATSATFVITASPTATGIATIPFVETLANGAVVYSSFQLSVGIPPTVSAPYITYPIVNGVQTTDVGVGATAQLVTIYGSGFMTGATITAFTNSASAADAAVTAKVVSVSVNGTQITADIAVAAGDTNKSVGYTITNTNGSSVSVAAFQFGAIAIGAAPTVTSVSPTAATPSSTNALTITGTGFAAGATVTPSSGGSCAAATVVSATSITVSCTFGAEGSAPVTLMVANVDGGSATSAAVLPAATPVKPKPPFRITGVHGVAVSGRSVNIAITGTGFYGQPHVSTTAAGTRATVSKDHGNWMLVRVTVKAGTGKGEHTFTFTLANGKSVRANYKTI